MICPTCGQALDPAIQHLCVQALPADVNVAPIKAAPVPFAPAAATATLAILLSSAAAYLAAYGLACDHPKTAIVSALLTVAAALAIFSATRWRAYTAALDDEEPRRHLLITVILCAIALPSAAAIAGDGIGNYQRHFDGMSAHSRKAAQLANKIGLIRSSSSDSIEDSLKVFKAIEPDVVAWNQELVAADTEWSFYESFYPEQKKLAERSRRSLGFGKRRSQILLDEIAVARKIEGLPDAERQRQWTQLMEPLISKEDALDAEIRAK